ncbi:MAG: FHA domain-containing protein [Candidatus Viridilinea halotolerans]|uniref:non-specific serine/threonine protein kinase n=1 Tax=Candidatus Viridilinea halotolerans TaxID=2491704 RepID=A0A426TSA9_9CHLR|nr:MAG: FHA domain-containing protein [Candidatus Viridilinea halotolerans]
METIVIVIIITLLFTTLAGVGIVFWLLKLRNPGAAGGPSASGPRLQVSVGDGRVRELPLPKRGELTVGRDPKCTLAVEHHLVSRRHARIVAEGQQWVLEDTNSSNGTFLNSRSIMRMPLSLNDLIEIGPARLTVVGLHAATPLPATPPRTPQPGPATGGAQASASRQLFGNYVVVRNLDEGGFGKVMLAQERNGQRLVALKLLSTNDDYIVTKFRQEGAIKLDHPHIARIYDTGEVNGRLYIAMEYVEGVSLRKLIGDRPMALDAALIIAGQMLQALDYAHRNKIIHRDIKPENVMVGPQHGVKIIDFGIAKVLSTVTRTRDGMMIGTPQYMSYEQAMGQPVTPGSDIYSTAIVLYELLTTNVPFAADSPLETIKMHQQARPMPPRKLNPAIPPEVEAAIMRAMEKDQSVRFQGALEFAAALNCPLGQPLPDIMATTISRQSLAVRNELGNAADLQTRAPMAISSNQRTQPVLRVESGPRRGQVITLAPTQVIGRMEIDPADGTISRQHFRLEKQQNNYIICDSSTYGTIVNGTRLQSGAVYPLKHGAQIQVGQTVLIYEYHG